MKKEKDKNCTLWSYMGALLCFLLLAGGCGSKSQEFLLATEETAVDPEAIPEPLPTDVPEIPSIYVDVEGAVRTPGVYEMPEGARVFEAIEAAGGFLPEARAESVNQAARLTDGQQIRIPRAGEAEELTSGTADRSDGRINLNTATEEELCTLTGIGVSKARAILRYREEHGAFASIEELMQVEGIKQGTFTKIQEDIMV